MTKILASRKLFEIFHQEIQTETTRKNLIKNHVTMLNRIPVSIVPKKSVTNGRTKAQINMGFPVSEKGKNCLPYTVTTE